ncbi:AMP-binding protein [Bacillus aquiflavi]|uniref:AMP-binding protein n=1 Tax=Bacillus aquiflavi TaxID=2672567 RepID=A0A6B3VRG2_9BACI|nr:long-chain-fatty-acid--CoA ligase [Bacillus aquiflavi]MBA4536513.1 AMP-binding protein [Bacillus aquiflavi]NEY80880.1 AMP-binding protein [Bacillus aquiflavi]
MKHQVHFKFWPPRMTKTLTVPETTLYENLLMTTKKYPQKIAIHYYGTSYTYKQLLNEVEALAYYLEKELRVKKGEHVLLFMQNSPQFIIGFFAILRIRAIVVPINPMSTTNDLEFYIKDGNIKTALVGQELYEKLKIIHQNNLLKNIIIATYSDYINENEAYDHLPSEVAGCRKEFHQTISWNDALTSNESALPYCGESEDVTIVPYTSGTTGLPKGCVHTNKTVQANTVGAFHWLNMTSDSVSLTTLPLFHVTGLVHSALAPIFAGSTIVLLTRWDREYASAVIEKFGCSHWINISTMLIDFLANPNIANYNLSSLVLVGGGGAPLPEAVGKQLYKVTGLDYVEGYGLSETMSHTHFNPPHRPKLQCLGIPAFNVDARVVHPETGKEVSIGEEGELVVNGPQLFEGYYRNEEENKANHMTINGKRFFRTGDIVKMDHEGYFFLVDRLKRMINASGFKVWPTEVESILYKHPAVQQACVVRAQDLLRGETVKAFIILKEEYRGKITDTDLINWSKKQMAAYKYPRIVEFRESFPTTSSGKVLWRKLQE